VPSSPIRSDQVLIDLSHISVTELLHSLFDLVLVGLDIAMEASVLLLSFVFFIADSVVGDLIME
jgi:hypothetical protein